MYEYTPEQKKAAHRDPAMVDLETLGVRPTSAIISIGACKFDPNTFAITDVFHQVISRESLSEYPEFTVDQSTIDWWENQTDEAKAASYSNKDGRHIKSVLIDFAEFAHKDAEVWGNGSDFDNVLLAHAYNVTGVPLPWKFWNNRCYRTMKNQFPEVAFSRQGTHHNAMHDAISQAKHLMRILARQEAMRKALG
jgi:hypothetical protein